jgi:hypothetical protein
MINSVDASVMPREALIFLARLAFFSGVLRFAAVIVPAMMSFCLTLKTVRSFVCSEELLPLPPSSLPLSLSLHPSQHLSASQKLASLPEELESQQSHSFCKVKPELHVPPPWPQSQQSPGSWQHWPASQKLAPLLLPLEELESQQSHSF